MVVRFSGIQRLNICVDGKKGRCKRIKICHLIVVRTKSFENMYPMTPIQGFMLLSILGVHLDSMMSKIICEGHILVTKPCCIWPINLIREQLYLPQFYIELVSKYFKSTVPQIKSCHFRRSKPSIPVTLCKYKKQELEASSKVNILNCPPLHSFAFQ